MNAVADRVKVSNKEYKIGVIVSASKNSLRKSLEDAGIIKGLNMHFLRPTHVIEIPKSLPQHFRLLSYIELTLTNVLYTLYL